MNEDNYEWPPQNDEVSDDPPNSAWPTVKLYVSAALLIGIFLALGIIVIL